MLLSWLALGFIWVAADPATPSRLDRLGLNGTNELAVRTLLRFHSAAVVILIPAVLAVVALPWPG